METINVTDMNVSELIDMLNKLCDKNLYLYWIIQEQKDKTKFNNIATSIEQVLEHYRNQIAKMYMLNIIEQNVLNEENTQLNSVLMRLKNILNTGGILDEKVINGLYLSNLETIFNDTENYGFSHKLEANGNTEKKINENKYLNSAFQYANSFNTKVKIMKKIPNIV